MSRCLLFLMLNASAMVVRSQDAQVTGRVAELEQRSRQWLQTNYDSSLVYAEKAHQFAIQSNDQELLARSLRHLGDVESYQDSRLLAGLDHLYQALRIFRNRRNIAGECETLLVLGNTLKFYDSSYNQGLQYLYDALRLSEETKNTSLMARSLDGIGGANFLIASYTEASRYFERSLALIEKDSTAEGLRHRAEVVGNISLCFFSAGKYEESYRYLSEAIRLAKLTGNDRTLATGYLNMAEYYTKTNGDADRILEYALKAMPLAVAVKHSDMMMTLDGIIGKAYLLKGNLPLARFHLQRSLDSAVVAGDFELQGDAHEDFYTIYKQQGKWREALTELELFKLAADKARSNEHVEMITRAEARYQGKIHEQQIRLLEAERSTLEIQQASNRRWVITIGAAGLILALVVYFLRDRYHRRTKAMEVAIQLQNQKSRIRQELHDNLGGQLSSLSLGLSQLNNGAVSEPVAALTRLTNHALDNLRHSLWELDRVTITVTELEEKITSLFWSYRKLELPVRFELDVTGHIRDRQFAPDVGGNVFRIVQESVHNAVKHSGADLIRVRIGEKQAELTITIEDNGLGFSVTDQPDSHYGLSIMKRRAAAIQASLTVTSSTKGTVVCLKLQMESKATPTVSPHS